MRRVLVAVILLAALAGRPQAAPAEATRQSVYVNLADSLQGSFDSLKDRLRVAFITNGWDVLAVHDVAVDSKACASRASVLVLHDPRYAERVLAHGPRAAFALPVRVVLYEDEAGTHLAAVNPLSINRTIVAEAGFEGPSRALIDTLARIAGAALPGRFSFRPYGQYREQGLIGRTMGVMAGGPFLEKLKEVHVSAGGTTQDLARVADRVWKGVQQGAGRGRWQIRGIYRLDLSARGVVVIGVSGASMEAKSFAIVGSGGDRARARYACAGIAHAAAYPIEIVVYLDQDRIRVTVVDGMYRMKMYFEDAGKLKFAANMGMPGSIEDEIRALILAGVNAKP